MAVGFGIQIAVSPPVVSLEEDEDMGYIVSFDSQGGSFVPAVGVITGDPIETLPTPPTRTGYSFLGWFTTAVSGGSQVTAQTVPSDDMTAFARWSTSPIPRGTCRVEADSDASQPVNERSAKGITLSFLDEADAAMAPDTVSWSLYNGPGSIVNARENVSATPGTTVRIVLDGDDNDANSDHEIRKLVVTATYTSTDGSAQDLVAEFQYSIVKITGK